ncbi:unnamed protein product [Gongylonema pulchrum]|uniref:G_PROTEIN_RECEP_F1_2 domain-containing protein n=1 Tax=Gongylonema pulchrum TaxID=637853 RepID=A0A183DQC8_9BILA|nr:unnamed protein product [Gongylonema pulchrum]
MIPLIVLGIFGNVNIIVATIFHRNLHNQNAILIGIIAFFDLISCLMEGMDAALILTHHSRMPRKKCFHLIIIYLFVFNCELIILLYIAFNRFVAVCWPFRYQALHSKYYVIGVLFLASVFSIPFIIINAFLMDAEAVNPCDPPLALVPRLSFAWTSTCTVLQLLILILNIVIVIKLFCNSKFGNLKNQGFHRNRQRMTLTLTLMTALYAVSMVTATLLIFITKNLPISPTLQDSNNQNFPTLKS